MIDMEHLEYDPVNKPYHYNKGGMECMDAMIAAFGTDATLNFCLLNAFKYLWRNYDKNGLEDVEKANWYLKKAISLMEGEDKIGAEGTI